MTNMSSIVACSVQAAREARGLSQQALAQAAGTSRQAVAAVEKGRMQPGIGLALALSRVLGVAVEELFALSALPELTVRATIDGRRVTHRLGAEHLAIEPVQTTLPTLFLAGCDLAAGLLSRYATLRGRDLRVLWLPRTNDAALEALTRGEVHAAVVHDSAASTGPPGIPCDRFELARTEEGWILAAGNPLGFCQTADLARKRLRLVNRPPGAGARRLLDERLHDAGVDASAVDGYDRCVPGQLDVGRAIAHGFADAGIGMASVARVHDLAFLPLREERCVLLVPRRARMQGISVLLEALASHEYRRDVASIGTYDVNRTGEQIA
jgi:putative molybdopterin biosynthesis protein